MGFIFGIIKNIIKLILYVGIFFGIVVLIPNLPPYTKFTSIELTPTQARVGPLAPNGALNNAKKLYVDKVMGPEAFQLLNGELYTSLSTGEIVKLSPGGHVTFVTKIGQPCTGLTQEHICGRPLGFEIDEKNNVMYVADAYYGIWKVDLKNDKKQLLVSPRVEIAGRVPKIFNCLALGKNGDVYWTDSTSDFSLKDGAYGTLTDPSGRLFYYNAARNESKVLLDDLWFSNGVVVSPDGQFVLVAETGRYRVLKYYVEGPKKGKSEVFVDGLPGTPDNMRVLPDGSGVLVSLYVVFDEEHPILVRSMSRVPLVRKFLARLQRLIEIPFEYLNTLYPHVLLEDIVYHIGHFKSINGFLPPMSGLLQVDWNGNIVASYINTDGSLGPISDAIVFNNKLYTGSPGIQNFVGEVSIPPLLQKAFASTKKAIPKTVEKEAPKKPESKPQQTTPKPKVEEKKEEPKVVKPVVQQPKPTQPPKPAEVPKTTTPKPVEKPAPAKPAPKQAESKSAPAQKQPEAKPATKKPETKPTTLPPTQKPVEVKTTTPKPEVKPAATQKPVETKAKPAAKSGSAKTPHAKAVPNEIPIEEVIPSDTAKPNKETLKVIKKGGPTEIPNINV